jgi:hypothetical protein
MQTGLLIPNYRKLDFLKKLFLPLEVGYNFTQRSALIAGVELEFRLPGTAAD